MIDFSLYVIDTETSGLDPVKNDVIELSIFRLKDNIQKTWCLKPINIDTIESAALRINGHKLEDLLHQTKFGRDTYLDPNKVIVEVENWMMDDDCPTENKCLIGQNVPFDIAMIKSLWDKCNSLSSFPFGRRYLDTMSIEFFLNYCQGEMLEGYSLNNLVKKYGIKNTKAHTAEADTLATKEVFEKQVEFFKSKLSK